MSRLGTALANLAITVASPDGSVQVASRGNRHPIVTFLDTEAYFDHDAASLREELDAVLAAHAYERHSARHAAVSKYSELDVIDESHWNAVVRRNQIEWSNIVSHGISIEDAVEIESVGLRDWSVTFTDDALNDMSPGEFLREVNSALLDTYQSHAEKLHELKTRQSV